MAGRRCCSCCGRWRRSRPGGAAACRRTPKTRSSAEHRSYLETLARDTWRFFEHVVGPEDNHLPPDNLQLEPEPTIAHRTSPTNIGMYLLASCCAREFGWIDTAALAARLEATLDTVDRLDKHEGHLYNWYDTQIAARCCRRPTCRASTAATSRATCWPWRRPAAASPPTATAPGAARWKPLALRCEALCAGMDFRGLYDAKRHLFHIGLRVDENVLDASYYDLLASESRLLSFLAIAKGDVPRRHWMALGRPFLSVGVRPGLKSWSGSMFEYLMPALVMPEPRRRPAAGGEPAPRSASSRPSAHAQNLPWGVSESAYFAQDHSLAYQYSPFGVPRLALRRTPPTDRVVAPYASVMAAVLAPARCGGQPAAARIAGRARRVRLLRRGRLHRLAPARRASPSPWCATSWRTTRACRWWRCATSLRDDAPRRWFGSAPLVQAHDIAAARAHAAADHRQRRSAHAARARAPAKRRRSSSRAWSIRWRRASSPRTCCRTAATPWRCAPTAPA